MATPAATAPRTVGLRRTLRGYFLLTKPRIIELLLITTVPTMIVAQEGIGDDAVAFLRLVAATLVGGSLAAGGANVFNCWCDRDIDARMARTRNRPLPMGDVTPNGALLFGVVLTVLSFVWLGATVNLVSALLALAANAFYVFVYTIALKRSTPQNIVIGGAAGAVPVLIGWAAVTGDVFALSAMPAWVAFLLIFYWTPPHFWALAIKYRDDYEEAGVPMLPVVSTIEATASQILRYSWVMVAMSLLFFAVAHMGLVYLGTALVLGGVFLKTASDLKKRPTVKQAMLLFHFSITYLGLVFASMAVDVLLLG
jgi:protoheme IX farnesyltransferase